MQRLSHRRACNFRLLWLLIKMLPHSAPSFKELNNLFTRNLLSKPNFVFISFFIFSVKESEGPQEVLVPHLSLRIFGPLGSRISVIISNRALHFTAVSCNYNHLSAKDQLGPIQSLISAFRIPFNNKIFMWKGVEQCNHSC